MNLQEFAGLKVGDEVINHMRNDGVGVVSAVTKYGVKIQWPPSAMEWEFSNQSTAWMHWSKKTNETKDSPGPDTAGNDGAQAAPGATKGTAQG